MTKIIVYDTYLHTEIKFYVNQTFSTKEEAEKILRLKDYLYFPLVDVLPVNKIKSTVITLFYKSTTRTEDVLFSHVKYLIIN